MRGLALHAHSFAISVDTFKSTSGLNDEMKITQTDVLSKDGKIVEFVNAMESQRYPIFATMYHPEYQVLDQIGPEKWRLVND